MEQPAGTQQDDAAEQGHAELRAAVRAAMEGEHRLSQTALAREAGISATTLSQWINGRYQGDIDAVADRAPRSGVTL